MKMITVTALNEEKIRIKNCFVYEGIETSYERIVLRYKLRKINIHIIKLHVKAMNLIKKARSVDRMR